VLAALELVEQFPEAGLPPAHVGVAAGPVVVQGGDYFGRTVNLAARIAARADVGQVLVSQRVAESTPPEGVTFVELGELPLKGLPILCGCSRPCRAAMSDAPASPVVGAAVKCSLGLALPGST
jgi:class 3 adenylate cyclase